MKKIFILLLSVVIVCSLKAQTFPNVAAVKTYINDSIVANRQLKASSLNKAYQGIVKFLPDAVQDTASVSGPTHGLYRFQRKDSTLYVYDTILNPDRWVKAVTYPDGIVNQGTSKQTGYFWISNTGRYGEKREETGNIVYDHFTGAGFGSGYDTSVTNITRTFNGSYLKDSVKGAGEGSLNNYITVTAPTGRSNWTQEVKWLATRKNLQDYGIGIGLRSTNSFFSPDFFVHFVWRNNLGQNGSVQLYLDNLTPGSPYFITHDTIGTTIADTIISRVTYNDGVITINYTNQTTGETVDTSYTYGTATAGTYQAPNTAKFVLRFLGGVHKIFYWKISSTEKKGSVLFRGNSITYGYTASVFDSTYPAQVFSERMMYEKNGGPGDRSADAISNIAEIISLRPKYLIYSIGVNDKQSSVSAATYGANVRRFMDSMVAHGIKVIILSNTPLNSSSIVSFNDTLQDVASDYGFKYVNDFDSLRNGGTSWNSSYTVDNIHPNGLGHVIRARILAREAPEILGDTAIAVNRLLYKSGLQYVVGYDPSDGIFKVTKVTGGSGGDMYKADNLLGLSNYSTARTNLGLAIGSDVQAYSSNLGLYSAITPSANTQTFLGSANYAAMRTQLGLVISTDVQPYSSNLVTFAGIAPSANVQALLGAANYAAFKTSLSLDNVDNTSDATKNSASVTLTNKIMSGSSNTFSNIAISSLSITGTPNGSKFLRDDGSWQTPSGSSGWGLTGNASTTAGTNFIGTTDAIDFVAKTNSLERFKVEGSTASGKAKIFFGASAAFMDYAVDAAGSFTFSAGGFQIKTTSASYVYSNSVATGTFYNGTITIGSASAGNGALNITNGTTTRPLFVFSSSTKTTTASAGYFTNDANGLYYSPSTTWNTLLMTPSVNSVSPTSPDRTITVNIGGTTYYIAAKTTND